MAEQKVAMEMVNVTPEQALKWLANKTKNRGVRKGWVSMLAHDMIEGKYVVNGQPIIFDKSGQLLDGQHRLMAIVEAKVAIKMLIMRHIDADAFKTIDSGIARKPEDVLGILGENDAKVLAASLRLLWIYRAQKGKSVNEPTVRPTRHDILKTLDKEPEIRASISHRRIGIVLGKGSVWVFLHYILSRQDAVSATAFMDYLYDGTSLHRGDPILALREQIIRAKVTNRKLSTNEIVMRAFRAWNLMRKGARVVKIQLTTPDADLPAVK